MWGPPLDLTLELIGIVAEMALVALLTWRRAYTSLPFFYAYIVWGVISDSAMLAVQLHHTSNYLLIFLYEVLLDSVLQYLVLIELTRLVLCPFRSALPRGTLAGFSLLILAIGAAAWPFAAPSGVANISPLWTLLTHLEGAIAILRILFFLALAAGSHLLSIGWHNRELQVATGLGVYSLVSFAGLLVHSHQQAVGDTYHAVDLLIAASYFLSMLYWIFSFAQNEAPRGRLTSPMRTVLTAIAGVAGVQRAFVEESISSRAQD